MPKKIRILKKEMWDVSGTLADIIHQYLVAFKAYDRHLVLYSPSYENPDFDWSKDEVDDQTEWFLDELIWTFGTIANNWETPELSELIQDVFGGNFLSEDGTVNVDRSEHPRYDEYKTVSRETNERIKKGLDLFAKHFGSLWD